MRTRMALTLAAMLAFPAAAMAQFSGSGPGGPIPDGSGNNVSGSPFVSTINVPAAFAGPIANVSVSFDGLAHTWVGDTHATLTSPSGQILHLWSRPGRGAGSTFGFSSDYSPNNSYAFADGGDALFAVAPPGVIPSGTYTPSSNPNPPETNSIAYNYTPTSFASTFGGHNPVGTWTLEITDWAGGDTGSVGGWTLNVSLVPEPSGIGFVLAGSALALVRRRR